MSRFLRVVEQQIDIFVDICQKYVKQKGLEKKIWVSKDEEASVVGIGDPDKVFHSKDYGFCFYYEMIFNRFDDAVEEFKFKLDHFIKVSKSSNRFPAFRDDKEKEQSDS